MGTSANRSAKEFIIDGQKITRKMNKRHLGSYFSGTYDHGKSNCAQRVAMSRRIMETQLRNVLLNREIKRKLKLVLYRSDVVSVAMHGVEYWNIRKTGESSKNSRGNPSCLSSTGHGDRRFHPWQFTRLSASLVCDSIQ